VVLERDTETVPERGEELPVTIPLLDKEGGFELVGVCVAMDLEGELDNEGIIDWEGVRDDLADVLPVDVADNVAVEERKIPSMRIPTSGLLSRLAQFVQLPPALVEYPAFRIWTVLPQAIGKLPVPHTGPLLGSLKFGKLALN